MVSLSVNSPQKNLCLVTGMPGDPKGERGAGWSISQIDIGLPNSILADCAFTEPDINSMASSKIGPILVPNVDLEATDSSKNTHWTTTDAFLMRHSASWMCLCPQWLRVFLAPRKQKNLCCHLSLDLAFWGFYWDIVTQKKPQRYFVRFFKIMVLVSGLIV